MYDVNNVFIMLHMRDVFVLIGLAFACFKSVSCSHKFQCAECMEFRARDQLDKGQTLCTPLLETTDATPREAPTVSSHNFKSPNFPLEPQITEPLPT